MSLEVVEEDNYYPFGLKHKNYNATVQPIGNAVAQKYKYNGKELQDELGLNIYDYGARNYDPSLGRWLNIDPLAEKYYNSSPYIYVANNPVMFVDPDGMEVDVTALVNSNSKEDQWLKVELMISLADISGMTISTSTDKNGKTTLKGKEDEKNEGKSSSASKYVSHLLTMSDTITVEGTDEGSSSNPSMGKVFLDSAEINGIQQGLEKKGIDKNVMSVGMAFLHETIHTKFGANWWKKPKSNSQKNRWGGFTDYGDGPGDVESRLNIFRKEMGLPTLYKYTRASIMYVLVKDKKVEVPISNVSVK